MVADTTICQTTMTAAVQLSGSSFCSASAAATAADYLAAMAVDAAAILTVVETAVSG